MYKIKLSEDLLPSIPQIAEYVYGNREPRTVARVRNMIEKSQLPAVKRGGRYESRRSWINQSYARPDNCSLQGEDAV